MLHNGVTSSLNYTQMTLDINTLKNTFFMHIETQDYRLKHPNVLR